MFTIVHQNNKFQPRDIELFEEYDGEAKELIVQEFLDNGMYTNSTWALDSNTEEEIEFENKDYLSTKEIEYFKYLEETLVDDEWNMTVKELLDLLGNIDE